MEEEKKELLDSLKEKVKEPLKQIEENGINENNVDYTYRLIDIYKDIQEIKCKEDIMRYGRDYGDSSYGYGYGAESYGRRGVPGTGRRYYRGEEALDEMKYHYGNYQNSGSYGAKEDSAYKMTEALKKFIFTTTEELEPNEKMMFKKALQEIMQNMDM